MSLTRLINKTPLQNEKLNIYEIDNINNQLIEQIINSRFLGDGVYGIESFSMTGYKEHYMFTPSFDKYEYNDSNKKWDFKGEELKELSVFELALEKNLFMPLDIKQFIDVFNINFNSTFIQVLLCKRNNTTWRTTATEMYLSYLKGNDTPLENKFAIKLQDKLLNIFNKVGNITTERERIEEIENKIFQNNYRFECRFIVFGNENVDKFVSELTNKLQKLTLFNEITIKNVKNKKNMLKLIENRSFSTESVNQILSQQEVFSLLSNRTSHLTQKVELEKSIPKQSITKSLEDSMLLQKAIQFMPFSEKRNVEIDQFKAQQINQAFRRVGIINKDMKVTEMYQGSSLLKVQMEIPNDITFTTISKKLVDIKSALGNQNISIEMTGIPDTINVFLPLENREVIYFRDILESDQFKNWCKNIPLPFIIGGNVNGELMFADLAELRHLLITGATGSGKSVFVNLLILCLLLSVPSDELALYLIDPKQVEYAMFKGFPQVKKIETNMEKANKLLESLVVEMENRYTLFAKNGVKNISSYNKNNEQKIPYIVVAVDEYADLVMINPKVEEHLVRLGQKSRAAGIHLIICTQKPLADIVTSVLKSNLPSAISFRLKTSSDYMTVFGKGIPYNLLGKGDGVAKLEGQMKEYERFQSPILTLDEDKEDEIYTNLKELFKDVVVDSVELPEVKVEEPIDKLKRIIAETNELRVSELGRLMQMGNNKVHEFIKELVDEEWLRKDGRGYVVNVDDEELNKWREKE